MKSLGWKKDTRASKIDGGWSRCKFIGEVRCLKSTEEDAAENAAPMYVKAS